MIRGISKQVIVVGGGNCDFFEEAIFFLKDTCVKNAINEKDLLRQAKNALTDTGFHRKFSKRWVGVFCASGGFVLGSCLWMLVFML